MAGRQRQLYLIVIALVFLAGLFVATAYFYTQSTLLAASCD